MPAVTITDLENAALDLLTLGAIANSEGLSVVDRLGQTRPTMTALEAEYPAASANAASALASKNAAAVSESSAAAAKVTAEAARDAAIIGSGVYGTEATGRAAVADGEAYKVQGAGDVAAFEYRRINSSTSVLIAIYPSSAAVAAIPVLIQTLGLYLQSNIRSTDGLSYPMAMLDAFGSLALGISDDGSTSIGGVRIRTGVSGFPFAICDDDGAALLLIDKSGALWHAWQAEALEPPASLFARIKATGMMELSPVYASRQIIVGMGQSNSIGTETSATTTTQPYANIMFAGGMSRRVGDSGSDETSLIPCVETSFVNGDDVRGETGLATLVNNLTARAIARGDTAANNVHFAFSAGIGGQSISSLLVGANASGGVYGDLWQYFSGPVGRFAALSTAAGKTAAITAIKFDHGEQDIAADTPRADYFDLVLEYFGHVAKVAKSAFWQKHMPLICMTQKFTHRRLSKNTNPIALAQRDLALAVDSVMLTHPDYCLQGMQSSGLHYSAVGQQQSHSYAARAIDYVKTTGHKWRGVDVISVLWQAQSIEVGINDPAGLGLLIDTSYIAAAPNYGFDLWSVSAGGLITGGITGITLRKSGVSITTATGLPDDVELVAGRGRPGDPASSSREYGPRTNIRDRADETDAIFAKANYLLAFSHFKSQGNLV